MIIFSDLHLDADSADVCLNEVLPGILEAVRQNNDPIVAMLGDFWHLRYRLEVRLLNAVTQILKSWTAQGIRVRMLPGNHDQIDVAGRNALEVLGEIPGVTVFTEPQVDEFGAWVPYRRDGKMVRDFLASVVARIGNQPLTCFLHHGVVGAIDNYAAADAGDLHPNELPRNGAIFCGHYHRRQCVPNSQVIYVGSPRQVTANEAGQTKGFTVWDPQRGVVREETRIWGPRYHQIQVGADGQVNLPAHFRAGDEVRVTAPEALCEAVSRGLDKLGARHVVTPELIAPGARLSVGPLASLAEYAGAYVEREAGDLDRARLLQVYREVVTGAQS